MEKIKIVKHDSIVPLKLTPYFYFVKFNLLIDPSDVSYNTYKSITIIFGW